MDLTNFIELQLNKYTQNINKSFIETCSKIAQHKNAELVSCTDKIGVFEITILNGFKSRLTISNSYKYEFVEPEDVLNKVIDVTKYDIDALKSKWRKRELVEARQAYMIISKKITKSSLDDIGKLINRNHSTVLHAIKNQHIPEIQQIIKATNLL